MADLRNWREQLWESQRRIYRGDEAPAAAMPLGGLGTGSIALCADGSLRQWQIFNQVNHVAFVPQSFFAVWARRGAANPVVRVLMDPAAYATDSEELPVEPAPLVTDHIRPRELAMTLMDCHQDTVQRVEMVGEYPIAELTYYDDELPIHVRLEAFSPMIALDERNSGLPAILFMFHIRNPSQEAVQVSLIAAVQNAVGYDGVAEISDNRCHLFGGNVNRVVRMDGWTAVDMANVWLPADACAQGTMALAALADDVSANAAVERSGELLQVYLGHDGRLRGPEAGGPSPRGQTLCAGLAGRVTLPPGEEREVPFVLAWHFPNRYVNWSQGGFGVPDDGSKLWIGNWYATWLPSAMAVCEYVRDNFRELVEGTRDFRDALYDTTLPYWLIDAVTANMSTPRSPTCFRTADGNFYGFEGCCGASTGHCAIGGCCPLNCTHVWNYEMTLAKLFPRLEQTMRSVDLLVQMTEDGAIPHRTVLPLWLPRWADPGPHGHTVAADGHFGTILKAYREWLISGDRQLLDKWWPSIKKAMKHGFQRWDADGDGLLDGHQWNTYDLHFFGWNTFCSGYYLAALRAAEEMARIQGDEEFADECRRRFESGRALADAELWNGEYYEQKVDLGQHPERQYATGCLSDQLIGQWWAHAVGLGYIFDPEHVRTALQSIFKYNWREELAGHEQKPRKFACDDEKGLLVTTWPRGGRPEVPMLYCDEVWTGCEYQVASHMFYEGLVEEAAMIVRGARERYDGRRRSPWNEIECGDHYARPMSSWMLLEMAAGFFYSAPDRAMQFSPRVTPENFKSFFITGSGWGSIAQQRSEAEQTVTIAVRYGRVEIASLSLDLPDQVASVQAELDGKPVEVAVEDGKLFFPRPLTIDTGQTLTVRASLA